LRAEQQDDALDRLAKTFDDEQKPTFVWQLDFAEVFHRSPHAKTPGRNDCEDLATSRQAESGFVV